MIGGGEIFGATVVGIGGASGDCAFNKLSISLLVSPFSCKKAVRRSKGALCKSSCCRNLDAASKMDDLDCGCVSEFEDAGCDGICFGWSDDVVISGSPADASSSCVYV